MVRHLVAVVALLALLSPARSALAVSASESPTAKPLAEGSVFPDIALTGSLTPEQAAGLGTGGAGQPPRLSELGQRAVIVEVFSMYCPHCQREAPELNALHELIVRSGLGNKLALIGIGAGNSQAEVDVYRKKFGTPFPLFTDFDFVAHKALGEVGTPHYYVLVKDPATGGYTVVLSRLGCMVSAKVFFEEVLKLTGLEQGGKK